MLNSSQPTYNLFGVKLQDVFINDFLYASHPPAVLCLFHHLLLVLFHAFIFIYNNPPIDKNNGANTRDTIVISLIRILIDGPEVSLNGSPTVSPTTAAL